MCHCRNMSGTTESVHNGIITATETAFLLLLWLRRVKCVVTSLIQMKIQLLTEVETTRCFASKHLAFHYLLLSNMFVFNSEVTAHSLTEPREAFWI